MMLITHGISNLYLIFKHYLYAYEEYSTSFEINKYLLCRRVHIYYERDGIIQVWKYKYMLHVKKNIKKL